MLSYKETMGMILSLERSIKNAQEDFEKTGSIEQRDYAIYCERLLKHYITEHRKAAEREDEYAMR